MHKRYRRNSRAFKPADAYQVLEDRQLLAVNLFVDFGDNFPGGTLSTTSGDLRNIADSPNPNDKILGVTLVDANDDYIAATPLNINAQTFSTTDRARMMEVVRRTFEPLDVNVVELTDSPQLTVDGRTVEGAASMADLTSTLRAGNSTWRDAYIFVAEFVVDPGGTAERVYGPNGGGTSPRNTLGVTSDLNAASNLHDDLAVVYTGGGFSFNTMNNISHEAGHALGLEHAITNAVSDDDINQFHRSEVMSYRNTNTTTSSVFSRFPMVRGDDNTPGSGVLVDYNDIHARAGQVTIFDQAANDANILANPNWEYVSGTGAHDIITITKNGANATVTIEAFVESDFSNPITVPGEADTVYEYSIPLSRPILVYAGQDNDRIVIDGDLGVDVTIDGMRGTDEIEVIGKGAASAVYRPGATADDGVDLRADYGGTLDIGGNTITFRNFDTSSSIVVDDVDNIDVITPNGADDVRVSPAANNRTSVSGTSGGVLFVPIEFDSGSELILNLDDNDTASSQDDEVIFESGITGVDQIEVFTGDGEDTIDASDLGANTSLVVFSGDDNDEIIGSAGNDEINSGDGDDLVRAGDGNDTINTQAGNDRVYGDDGDDVIDTGDGNDSVWGGLGDDRIETGEGEDFVSGQNGDDFISTGTEDDRIIGGNGNDRIYSGTGNDLVNGNRGNDTIDSGDGDDEVDGGSGNDNILSGDGNDFVYGNLGDDYISSGRGDDIVDGGGNDDRIVSGNGDDTVNGGNGNDTLITGRGHDTVFGDAGDDELITGAGNDVLQGGLGNDLLVGGDNGDRYEFVTVGGQTDVIDERLGNAGVDEVEFVGSLAGTALSTDHAGTTLAAAPVDQVVNVALAGQQKAIEIGTGIVPYIDYVLAPPVGVSFMTMNYEAMYVDVGTRSTHSSNIDWDDGTIEPGMLIADRGMGTISANHQFDDLGVYGVVTTVTDNEGYSADVTVNSDVRRFALLADQRQPGKTGLYVGGTSDNDVITFDEQKGRVRSKFNSQLLGEFSFDGGVFAYAGPGQDIVSMVEPTTRWATFEGGSGNDWMKGADGQDILLGQNGDDTLLGRGGVDYLYGGVGEDYLNGGTANDILYGGVGNDKLIGDTGDDRLYGDEGDDQLYGKAGMDILFGGDGNDRLFGESGDDILWGQLGNDYLYGGSGDDFLRGGGQRGDFVYGGDGDDDEG